MTKKKIFLLIPANALQCKIIIIIIMNEWRTFSAIFTQINVFIENSNTSDITNIFTKEKLQAA